MPFAGHFNPTPIFGPGPSEDILHWDRIGVTLTFCPGRGQSAVTIPPNSGEAFKAVFGSGAIHMWAPNTCIGGSGTRATCELAPSFRCTCDDCSSVLFGALTTFGVSCVLLFLAWAGDATVPFFFSLALLSLLVLCRLLLKGVPGRFSVLRQARLPFLDAVPPVLALRLEDGTLAASPEEADERWLRHFSSAECGGPTTPEEHIERCFTRQKRVDLDTIDVDSRDLPT